jgi:hypothetical protein
MMIGQYALYFHYGKHSPTLKNINILHEHKKLKDIDPLLKNLVENNIYEQYRDDKINHPL